MCGKSIGWCNGVTDLAGVEFLGYSKEVLCRGIVLLDLQVVVGRQIFSCKDLEGAQQDAGLIT
jgi:hypothetical protein